MNTSKTQETRGLGDIYTYISDHTPDLWRADRKHQGWEEYMNVAGRLGVQVLSF